MHLLNPKASTSTQRQESQLEIRICIDQFVSEFLNTYNGRTRIPVIILEFQTLIVEQWENKFQSKS